MIIALCPSAKEIFRPRSTLSTLPTTKWGFPSTWEKPRFFINQHQRRTIHNQLQGQVLENVTTFGYLGSYLSNTADIDCDVQHRLKCAATAFGRLGRRVLPETRNRDLKNEIKILVYKAVVWPALLHRSETWVIYRRHLNHLESFHQRCLRRILRITWEAYRPNISVLDEAETTMIEAIVNENRLRWTGHVVRMDDNRLPKQVFYGQLKEGKQSRGGQKKRYEDILKATLKSSSIDVKTWETLGQERNTWRSLMHQGVEYFEQHRRKQAAEKRTGRKTWVLQPKSPLPIGLSCPHCNKICTTMIGLFSQLRTHRIYQHSR